MWDAGQPAAAAVIPIGVGGFGAGSTLTTFNTAPNGAEVNGLVVDGITYQYSLGNGFVRIDGGPGTTNNVAPLNVVSVGNNTGVLTLMLPSLADAFGYGFAILTFTPVASATTVSLFNGVSAVGSLSFGGTPDPLFSGGFAGIQSTLPFNRVQVIFNSGAASAFALDNVRTRAPTVPEPGSVRLIGLGAGVLLRRRRPYFGLSRKPLLSSSAMRLES